MVRPADRRAWVKWVEQAFDVSERRACRATGVARSTITYRSRRPTQEPLRRRIKELAQTRVSYGYKRLHVLLRREGWQVNHKRVYRLYGEEGLALKRRRPKRRKSAATRAVRPTTTAANERWAMDFVHDTLIGGGAIRILGTVDVHTRECVTLVARQAFRGEDVARALSDAGKERGLPGVIQVDNGTEFTSRALDHWAYWNHVTLDFSRPGKPTDNAVIESFNASLRRECLSQHWFIDLDDAQRVLDEWRADYNNHRPHSSLGGQPPSRFRCGGHFTPDQTRLQNLQS